ncbi:NGG1p interacting factor 3, NIF3 [Rhodotorula toruloides]|uniref:NGG1p interacting factor 3, NIF3 n=1 Tax=Rhodotorula toruloides TaxID=5286 RepID=A0A511KM73_RHOTO|nr:NGG1p interacting factor 3, NIF3 [Rhodotorula toruloides]
MPSPTLAHLQTALQKLTPLELAESAWDNVGLMAEAPEPRDGKLADGEARKVYLCIDLTTAVCSEALSDPSTTTILSYHPPIFRGLKSFTLSNPLQASLLRCISSGVSVFTIHTAADNCVGSNNDFMASGLLQAAGVETNKDGMVKPGQGKGLKALKEASSPPEGHEGAGHGRFVDLLEGGGRKLSSHEAVQAVKKRLGLKYIQAAWSASGPPEIQTIAICAGSGGSVLGGVSADLYLTGEMSHHEVLAANAAGTHVICCNHTNTERPWLAYFAPRLQAALNDAAAADRSSTSKYEVVLSKEDKEPLQVV